MVQRILWLILALVHIVPALAVVRPSLLTSLYGLAPDDPLFLLMQHRAALFLAVFAACIWASFFPDSRRLATIVVGISMVSFLVLFALGGMPDSLRTIAIVDLAGLPFLIAVGWLAFRPS